MKKIFVKASTDLGVVADGTSLAPSHICRRFDLPCVEVSAPPVKKETDANNHCKNLVQLNAYTKQLFDAVDSVLKRGYFPVTIGGDHSIGIATALASNAFYGDLGVIWIDAHGDYNTFETTESGNIHGMPLAALSGCQNSQLVDFLHCPLVNPQKCVIVGARSLDKGEINNLRTAGCTVFTTRDICEQSVGVILQKAFQIANCDGNGVHVSFDVDVIDPQFAPGVTVTSPDGLTVKQAEEIFANIAANLSQIRSLDVVEYNPLRDSGNKTLDVIIKLLQIIL